MDFVRHMADTQGIEQSRILREMIHSCVTQIRSMVNRNLDQLPPIPRATLQDIMIGSNANGK